MVEYLIVGAGTAGSVLAARLSEDPGRSVLLIEAGEDIVPGAEPSDIAEVFAMSAFNPEYMWRDTRVHWRGAADSPAVPLQQGRILGGGSAVMGMWATRGEPADYDDWAHAGAMGWGWDGVLPYFRRLETDCDFTGPLHGDRGPIPIRRLASDRWPPFSHAVAAAARGLGMADVADCNGDFREGHCAMPMSRFEDRRGSSGLCYLTAEVRARSNLRIMTSTVVTGLNRQDRRITGVTVRHADGSEESLSARETIVAAGALRTPMLLLRAGIGDAEALRAAGIEVLANLPGVGKNLQNHPMFPIVTFLRRNGLQLRAQPAGANFIRYSSGVPGTDHNDMKIVVRSPLAWHALGNRMAALAPTLVRPCSRGQVRLSPKGPDAGPVIEFNFLDDQRDMLRMVDGVRRATQMLDTAELRRVSVGPMVIGNAAAIMRYNRVNKGNRITMGMIGAMMDLLPVPTRAGIARVGNLLPAAPLVADDEAIEAFLRENLSGTAHVAGTCRMGLADDRYAVTDAAGRVHQCEGVRIADASLMPNVPSGSTHIPVVMIGEKIAAAITGRLAT